MGDLLTVYTQNIEQQQPSLLGSCNDDFTGSLILDCFTVSSCIVLAGIIVLIVAGLLTMQFLLAWSANLLKLTFATI